MVTMLPDIAEHSVCCALLQWNFYSDIRSECHMIGGCNGQLGLLPCPNMSKVTFRATTMFP